MGTFIGAEHVRHVRTNWKNCLSENRGACSAASLFAIWNRSIAMTVHIHVIIMIRGERCGFTGIRSNSLFINSNTTIRENTEHIMQEKWRGSVEILSVRSIRRCCFRCRCIAENVGREDIIRRKFWHSN